MLKKRDNVISGGRRQSDKESMSFYCGQHYNFFFFFFLENNLKTDNVLEYKQTQKLYAYLPRLVFTPRRYVHKCQPKV